MKLRYKILLFFVINVAVTLIIPFLSVKLIPADAGMAVCMLMFFAAYPLLSILLGIFTSGDMKRLWWMPTVSALSFPLLFSLAMGGMVEELYAYSLIYIFLGYATAGLLLIIKKIIAESQK
jgi:hypothetical protein